MSILSLTTFAFFLAGSTLYSATGTAAMHPTDYRLSVGYHLPDADWAFRNLHPSGFHPNPIRSDPVGALVVSAVAGSHPRKLKSFVGVIHIAVDRDSPAQRAVARKRVWKDWGFLSISPRLKVTGDGRTRGKVTNRRRLGRRNERNGRQLHRKGFLKLIRAELGEVNSRSRVWRNAFSRRGSRSMRIRQRRGVVLGNVPLETAVGVPRRIATRREWQNRRDRRRHDEERALREGETIKDQDTVNRD
jgi:hypothetical protein